MVADMPRRPPLVVVEVAGAIREHPADTRHAARTACRVRRVYPQPGAQPVHVGEDLAAQRPAITTSDAQRV